MIEQSAVHPDNINGQNLIKWDLQGAGAVQTTQGQDKDKNVAPGAYVKQKNGIVEEVWKL